MRRLTTPQRNIWNLRKYYPDTSITGICGSMAFDMHIDVELLVEAIQHVARRQGALGIRIGESTGEPLQEESPCSGCTVERRDFQTEESFHAFAAKRAMQPFGLDGPLFEFLVATYCGKTAILLHMDHLIGDAWTVSLIGRHIYETYCALSHGEQPDPTTYSFFTAADTEDGYLSSTGFERDKEFWRAQYPAAPTVASIRPERCKVSNPAGKRLTTSVGSRLSAAIMRFEQVEGHSPAIVFEAAVAAYLARTNRNATSAAIGLAVLNRTGRLEKKTAGMFVSTVPLQVRCTDNTSVVDLLCQLKVMHREIFRHQRYPYELISQDVHDRFGENSGLFDVVVSYQNAQTEVPATTRWYFNGYCEVPLEVHIDRRDGSGSYTLNLDYQVEAFSDFEINLLRDRILSIVNQIVTGTCTTVGELDIVLPFERQALLNEFNDTGADYPRAMCVHELFRIQALETPDEIALVCKDDRISYAELDRASDAIAAHLLTHGVSPRNVIAIALGRDWRFVAAMLGVMKAGCAYLPIDLSLPDERISSMVATAKCRYAILDSRPFAADVAGIQIAEALGEVSAPPTRVGVCSDDPCYVLFTSGSIGTPKAVQIAHRNLVNFTSWNDKNVLHQCAPLGTCTSVLADAPFTFDVSVYEVLFSLMNGMKVVLTEEHAPAQTIAELMRRESVEVLHCTPTKLEMLMQSISFCNAMGGLKMIMSGAEVFPPSLLDKVETLTSATVYNGYGPSETTIGVSFKRLNNLPGQRKGPHDVAIGTPTANTQIYILDDDLRLLPIGVAGELCVAGEGVGLGYLNQPDLTRERFVHNPFATKDNGHGQTMYRTGDLARWREDGELEYLGRIDT